MSYMARPVYIINTLAKYPIIRDLNRNTVSVTTKNSYSDFLWFYLFTFRPIISPSDLEMSGISMDK